MKLVSFLGDSLDTIRSFPDGARRETGFQIDRVQRGLDPDDWKPMKTVGSGVREIRIRDAAGAFRVINIATVADAVSCFTLSTRSHRQHRDVTSTSPSRGSRT
jgi:phage-related protein